MADKLSFHGLVAGVQPRIRLLRSYDQRSHSYLGYTLLIEGVIEQEEYTFTLGIGPAAQAKHDFRAGDEVQGQCLPVADERKEPVEYYKASRLKILERSSDPETSPPPWLGPPPELEVYRYRGHRRLAARTYDRQCTSCIWGCRMAVEIIVDHWNPGRKQYRLETFCYGPLSCSRYRAGAKRTVPGRRGMRYVEEDWVDADATMHRHEDE